MQILEDVMVLDFSQFLSGPSASLRLADMGARVIKVERPVTGDICRALYVSDITVKGESTIFHAINRNKESFTADLKHAEDFARIKVLIQKADVMIHNFRPGVMDRLGLSYDQVKTINPSIIYASISGYGDQGEWKYLPGQDLLLQAVSGITYLNANNKDNPTPMGVAVADILAGTHLVQGILAALLSRLSTNEGALVEVSMLESLLDFQFEVLTCFYNDGNALPQRSESSSGHAYIAAPYGIYRTASGFLALAMADIPLLGRIMQCSELQKWHDPSCWFDERDEIKKVIGSCLMARTATEWLALLEPSGIWCAPVLDYNELTKEHGYQLLDMEQEVIIGNGLLKTTRCPIRIDGHIIKSNKGAPALGQHTDSICSEFNL